MAESIDKALPFGGNAMMKWFNNKTAPVRIKMKGSCESVKDTTSNKLIKKSTPITEIKVKYIFVAKFIG